VRSAAFVRQGGTLAVSMTGVLVMTTGVENFLSTVHFSPPEICLYLSRCSGANSASSIEMRRERMHVCQANCEFVFTLETCPTKRMISCSGFCMKYVFPLLLGPTIVIEFLLGNFLSMMFASVLKKSGVQLFCLSHCCISFMDLSGSTNLSSFHSSDCLYSVSILFHVLVMYAALYSCPMLSIF